MSPVHSLHLQGQVGVHRRELADRDAVGEVPGPRDTENALDPTAASQVARPGPSASAGLRPQREGLPSLGPNPRTSSSPNATLPRFEGRTRERRGLPWGDGRKRPEDFQELPIGCFSWSAGSRPCLAHLQASGAAQNCAWMAMSISTIRTERSTGLGPAGWENGLV